MIEFDETAGLQANLERLLLAADETDPELAPILRSVIGELCAADDEGTRRTARAKVNESVREQLAQLAEESSS